MSDPPAQTGLDDLDAQTWRRVSAVLDEALELAGDEVPAFLDRACAGDPALRARVESLLAADREAGDFLDRPVEPHSLELPEEDSAHGEVAGVEAPGRRVGPWLLVSEIGRGGMGTVHLAERADSTFEQRVAIKLVHRNLVSADIRARFLRERQILARLEHAHIARLLDGGVTEDGAPYLAMEWVQGVPITTWCERTRADLRDVIRLFLQVCGAVDHAHRSLVIHRDLKPPNILVTERGEVKLLDFGIAKLLEPGTDEADPGTVTVERRLTPHYAAPEQIRGESSTTATDVYGLGVVLYELLTGIRPFHARAATPTALERAVLEEDPPPPSTLLAGAAAGARQRAWRARVRGDLDRIVMQAMRKRWNERYATAHALIEDLERWLEGRAVRATPPTLGYRLQRFVGRNPVASVAGMALFLSLVAGLIGISWQAERAREEKRKAEAIRDFTLGLFHGSDPSESKGDTLTARQLLDRGAERVERELAGQPALQAEMLQTLGGVYRELEIYDRAQTVLERAVTLARQGFGQRSPKVAPGLVLLGAVLTDQARHAEAERTLNEALGLLAGRRRDPERAQALARLAVVQAQTGRFAAAESLYHEAIAIAEATFGHRSVPVAQMLDDLGTLYFDRRLYDQAAPNYERGLEIRLALLGRDDAATATSMENLAAAVGPLGRPERADSLHAAALAIYRRLLGPESIRVGNVLSNIGVIHYVRGEHAAAESTMSEAVRIFRLRLGDDHPETARALNNLGFLQAALFHYTEAESLYRIAIGSWRRTLGDGHPLTQRGETNLASVLRDQGRFAESEHLYRGVLARQKAGGDRSGDVTALACHHYGVLCVRTGRYQEAERLLRRALEIRRTISGGSTAFVGQSLSGLGEVLFYQGRFEESRKNFEEAAALEWARNEPDRLRAATLGLGRVLAAQGAFARAESLLLDAVAARQKLLGGGDPRTLEARAALGICYAAEGRRNQAEVTLREALPALERFSASPTGLLKQARQALGPRSAVQR